MQFQPLPDVLLHFFALQSDILSGVFSFFCGSALCKNNVLKFRLCINLTQFLMISMMDGSSFLKKPESAFVRGQKTKSKKKKKVWIQASPTQKQFPHSAACLPLSLIGWLSNYHSLISWRRCITVIIP